MITIEVTVTLIIVLVVAGMGAGIVTGLAGVSAAVVVTPLLVTFTDIDPYVAITVALITDVFASFFSYLTYKKNGNINLSDGKYLTIAACVGAFIGSYMSADMGDSLGVMGKSMTAILGINFFIKGLRLHKNPDLGAEKASKQSKLSEMNPILVSSVLGVILGLICGIVGAGGGLMILFVLTAVLNYDTKTAIGTSVLIMTFTALTGGVSHIVHIDSSGYDILFGAMAVTSVTGVIGAKVGAAYANKAEEGYLLMIVGGTFIAITGAVLGITLLG